MKIFRAIIGYISYFATATTRALYFDRRQTIEVRRDTLGKINKLIGAVMYHNGDKVSKSDIIAHAVDYLYTSVMKELGTVDP